MQYAPRVGFGNPAVPTTMVWFGILMEGREESIPDWEGSEPNISIRVISGSFPPVVEKELISFGPATVTWRLAFDSRDDLRKFRAKLGTEATLSIIAGIQSHIGVHRPVHGQGYEELPSTTLLRVDRVAAFVDGTAEADATFLRVIDPATGQAVP